MNLVGYLRVSTDRQAEEGLGLEVQEEAIQSWAVASGHEVVTWTRDEGIGGSNGIEDREGLGDALDAVRDSTVGGIVVYRLDRLARDLILQEHLLAEVRKAGGLIFSTSAAESDYMADDPGDPSRKLIRQILGAVAEYERAMIALRLRSGRQRKRDQGGYADGAPPLGWRAENGELVEDPDEQRRLARILQLHSEGKSPLEIGSTLDSEGIRPKRAQRWNPQTLKRIIERLDRGGVRLAGDEVAPDDDPAPEAPTSTGQHRRGNIDGPDRGGRRWRHLSPKVLDRQPARGPRGSVTAA